MKKHPVLAAGMFGIMLICGLTLTGCDIQTDDDTYTVRFNRGEGGGTEPDSQSVASGTSITLPGQGSMTPPSGKTFTGWKTGNQTFNAGASYTVTGDITFTAQWAVSGGGTTYTVHFDPGEGSGTAPDSQSVTSGDSIPLPDQGNMTPPSGKIFTGWKTGDQTYNVDDSYRVTSNITFTAQWAVSGGDTTYTVSFNCGEGSGTVPDSQSVASGTSIPLPGQGNMIPPSGKIFDGWKVGNQTYNANDSYTVTSDITFTAQWAPSSGGDIPGAPTGVTATAQSSSSISVSWNQVNGAISYEVYYETGNSPTKTLAGTVSGTSYTHTGLQASTTYTYYIKAKNSAGSSDYSSSDSATTLSSGSEPTDPDSAKVFIPLPWGDE
ncbi:MAG: InlB B-repeat-containing protein [Treponema sp.]|nr:InlB B-repeat-containing protein [Treponema sp.]